MEIVACDTEEFSMEYGIKNCLQDDETVFSTSDAGNVHLILQHAMDTSFYLSHVLLRGPGVTKYTQIACGCYHSMVLSEQGRVLAFGRNNKGQLGAGLRALASSELPMPIPPTRLGNVNAVLIAAGFYSSYILTRELDDEATSQQEKEVAEESENDVDCEAIYESVMKEMDMKLAVLRDNNTNLYLQNSLASSKHMLLIKLQTSIWSLIPFFMYQSAHSSNVSTALDVTAPSNKSVTNPCHRNDVSRQAVTSLQRKELHWGPTTYVILFSFTTMSINCINIDFCIMVVKRLSSGC